jgi:GNAT superfamily N-acetyltransferase
VTLAVRTVDTDGEGAGLEAFLTLPEEVYRGDPFYLPPAREDTLAGLRRPDFAGAQRALVAFDGDRALARCVARRSPSLRDEAGLPIGMLGFFEALEGSQEAVHALFNEAIRWLRETGAGRIVGPMDGDTWHRYRLNAGPFPPAGDPPFLLEPYNPPYYPALWESAGFRVLETYSSTWADTAAVARRLEPRHREALAAGYRLRPFTALLFEDELAVIYELSRTVFAGNFLYTEITEDEFIALYAGARPLIDPGLIWFARSPEGRDVGFLFAYPDHFRAVAALQGRRDLAAKLRFLWHRRSTKTVDVKTLGVLPEHRRAGVGAALMYRVHVEAQERGLRRANHCLFRDGNPSGGMAGEGAKLLRKYHLYEWSPHPQPLSRASTAPPPRTGEGSPRP